MSNSATTLMAAFKSHQSGNLAGAERAYREILATDAANVDARQLLGAVLVQSGKAAEAIPHLQQVVAARPGIPEFRVNLGSALSRQQRLSEAAEQYRAAIRIKADYTEAHRNLGSVLLKQTLFDEAIAPLRATIDLGGGNFEAHLNLGYALLRSDPPAESQAAEQFRECLKEQPDNVRALKGLGQSLLNLDPPPDEAIDCWQRLIELEPDSAACHNNLATLLKNLKRFNEAEAACRRALELAPDLFPARCNLGISLAARGEFAEARDCLSEAVSLHVTDEALSEEADLRRTACLALVQLSSIAKILGDQQQADEYVERALAIDSNDAESHMMRGFLHLARGDFRKGWPDYEWRKRGKHAPREFPVPLWDGSSQPAATILLHAEQGLGDTIHFIRYAKLVKERVGRVIFLCHRPIVRLIESCADVDVVVADGDSLPQFDLHAPLLSLPAIFETTVDSIPRRVPYLAAAGPLANSWQARLSPGTFNIGICWQGNSDFANDRYRSVPLRHFAPLAQLDDVKLFSLQKGEGVEQLDEIDFDVTVFPDLDTESGAFMDTAAVMTHLDLVVTSDTATAHLAGALGVPVWIATSFIPEWRWGDEGDECPWYPTARLFRARSLDDWDAVFARISDAVGDLREMSGTTDSTTGRTGGAIEVPVSSGELLDKITILEIKAERISCSEKLKNVTHELERLSDAWQKNVRSTEELQSLRSQLRAVNETLWDIEDAIRECERSGNFGSGFVSLARAVYINNDERAAIKKQVNLILGSELVEEKSYADYT